MSLLALVLHDVPAQEQHREENPYQRRRCCRRQEHVVLALVLGVELDREAAHVARQVGEVRGVELHVVLALVGKLQSFPTSS